MSEISRRKAALTFESGYKHKLHIPHPLCCFLDLTKAAFMSELHYWGLHNIAEEIDPDGWVIRTQDQWAKRIGISTKQVGRIASALQEKGYIETQLKKLQGKTQTRYKTSPRFYVDYGEYISSQSDTMSDPGSDIMSDRGKSQSDIMSDPGSDTMSCDRSDMMSNSESDIMSDLSYIEDLSTGSSFKGSLEENTPLTPHGGNEGEATNEDNSMRDGEPDRPPTPPEHEPTTTGHSTPVNESPVANELTEEDQNSAAASEVVEKTRMPALTQARVEQFQGIWNEIRAPWWAMWGTTDKQLKGAIKAFWQDCHRQELDAFEVFRIALNQARYKNDFWGKAPNRGDKFTPLQLCRKNKGHLFSLYSRAITPDDPHPYPQLKDEELGDVWAGPGEFDFDVDLITTIRESRASSGKAHDDATCASTVLWMIQQNLPLLRKAWGDAIARKSAIRANEAARQLASAPTVHAQNSSAYEPVAGSSPLREQPREKMPGWVKFMPEAKFNQEHAELLYEQSLERQYGEQCNRLQWNSRRLHPHYGAENGIFDDLSMDGKADYIEFLKGLVPGDMLEIA